MRMTKVSHGVKNKICWYEEQNNWKLLGQNSHSGDKLYKRKVGRDFELKKYIKKLVEAWEFD